MGARAAPGPHPRKFLRGKDQACRLRGWTQLTTTWDLLALPW